MEPHAAMTAQPGKGDELVDFLLKAPSSDNDDCVVFLVGHSGGNPDVVHVTEGWTSTQAHDKFFATDAAQDLVVKLQRFMAGEPVNPDEVPAGGKAAFRVHR